MKNLIHDPEVFYVRSRRMQQGEPWQERVTK